MLDIDSLNTFVNKLFLIILKLHAVDFEFCTELTSVISKTLKFFR